MPSEWGLAKWSATVVQIFTTGMEQFAYANCFDFILLRPFRCTLGRQAC